MKTAFFSPKVSLSELPLLPRFIPALKTLFAEEHAELEAKTSKRNKRKERDQGGRSPKHPKGNKQGLSVRGKDSGAGTEQSNAVRKEMTQSNAGS